MPKRTDKDHFSNNSGQIHKSNEKKSSHGITEKPKIRKRSSKEKSKKPNSTERQATRSKKSEHDLGGCKTKRKNRDSAFVNIENYLRSLSRSSPIREHRSHSFELPNTKQKTKQELRREKTIHVERGTKQEPRKQSKSEKKSKHGQLFYCQVETSSPFQQPAQEESHSSHHHKKRHKEKKLGPKNISIKVMREKLKEHNSKIIEIGNDVEACGDETNIIEAAAESHVECKRRRSRKKRSEELEARSKRKRSSAENNTSQSQFQEKIEGDLKSYFTRLQNLIDSKLEQVLCVNNSLVKTAHHKGKVEKGSNKDEAGGKASEKQPTTSEAPAAGESKEKDRKKRHESSSDKPKRRSSSSKAEDVVDSHPVETKWVRQEETHSKKHRDHKTRPKVTSDSPKEETETSKALLAKKEKKLKPRVAGEEKDSFRVEGIEPPNLEGGQGARKNIRKLECKTVSIIGIPPQPQGEALKYTADVEEALEQKKKTKCFELYYKYSVGGGDDLKCPNALPNQLEAAVEQKTPAQATIVPEKLTEAQPEVEKVHYKYFKDLPSSSSENSIESKKAVEQRCNQKKTRNFREFDSWDSDVVARGQHIPLYFIPEQFYRYDQVYRNRKYKSSLASRSDCQLSFNSIVPTSNTTKMDTCSERVSSVNYQVGIEELEVYNTEINEILHKTVVENVPQVKDFCSYPPVVLKADTHMNFWNKIVETAHPIMAGCQHPAEEPDLALTNNKFTFFSQKDLVDMMIQKYETCDVGTAAEKENATKEVAVEADTKVSINVEKVDVGVNVAAKKPTKVAAVETSDTASSRKQVKNKTTNTTKKNIEPVKAVPTPQKTTKQSVDIAGDAVVNPGKIGVRKVKNEAESKLKPKPPSTALEATENKSRCSKRSATAHTIAVGSPKTRPKSKWYHSLGGKFEKLGSLKRSQSEISFRNVGLDAEESKITSLVCLKKFLNDVKCDVSSKSNSHSLDRFCGKSGSSEAHTSSFFLTKDYKTADVSAYHRRKMYDEIIRSKMRKKGKVQSRNLAQQVFEVRFLTVDNFQRQPIPHQLAASFDKLPLVSSNTPSGLCTTKQMIETKILDLCEEMLGSRSLSAPQSKLGFISSCEFCRSQPNFANFVDCLRKTLTAPEETPVIATASSKAVEAGASEQLPVLNVEPQNSFEYLHRAESSEQYTVLGYTQCQEDEKGYLQGVTDSPSLEESGYESTIKNSSSIASFFERPKIAALLQPQTSSETLRMMKKCQEYAQKVVGHSRAKLEPGEAYEEVPLDILLSKVNVFNVKVFGSEPTVEVKKAQLETFSEAALQPFGCFLADLGGSARHQVPKEVSLIYENCRGVVLDQSQSFLSLGLTPTLSIETVGHRTDEELAQKILMSGFCIQSINYSTCCINVAVTDGITESSHELISPKPAKLRRMMVKKFFEDLLRVYEEENVFSSALMDQENFLEHLLFSTMKTEEEQKGCKGRRPKSSVGHRMVKFLAKKFLKAKSTCSSSSSPSDVAAVDERIQPEPVDFCWRESLQFLASKARKYFSMYVQAVRANREINDELKICGFQKLLENIEQGRVRFLRNTEKAVFEDEITTQVKQAFYDVYLDANIEAEKHHRQLSENDLKLIGLFVCKYRIGLLSNSKLIASCIGRGHYESELELKDAVLYLLKNVNSNLVEFKEYCEKCL